MKRPWPRYPLVYEINARVWVRELSGRHGRRINLATVPEDEIEAIARRGFDAIWLMGVWTTGPGPIAIARGHEGLRRRYAETLPDWTEADVVGSPFAVSHYEVSGELGGPAALAALRARLAYRGVRVVLDFVPNHTACDHPLLSQRPEAFVQGTEEDLRCHPASFFRTRAGAVVAHGRDPNFPAWTDTAQLNYGQRAAREAVSSILERIADRCDGVRCDMAMLLLPEVMERTWGEHLGPDWIRDCYWPEVISETLARHPHFVFLAESYWGLEWPLQEQGFHFTYDKTLYDRLLRDDHVGVRAHFEAESLFQDRCVRFIENHDEARALASFGPGRDRTAAVATFFSPGLRLFHHGQLEGRLVQAPVQLARLPVEAERSEVREFYDRVLSLLRRPTFKYGAAHPLEVQAAGPEDQTADSVVATGWQRRDAAAAPGSCYGVIVNLASRRAFARIPMGPLRLEPARRYSLLDHLDGQRYVRDGGELLEPGLFVALEPHQSHVLEITEVAPG